MVTVVSDVGSFVDALKKARLQKGITIVELAALIGTYRPNVSDWENGRVVPNIRNAIVWAAALDCVLALLPEEP